MATIRQNLENSLSRMSRGLIVRGVIAVAFGIAMVVWPGIGFGTLVLLVGAYAFVDGALSIGTAFTRAAEGHRGWLVFQGIAGVTVGVITYLYTPTSRPSRCCSSWARGRSRSASCSSWSPSGLRWSGAPGCSSGCTGSSVSRSAP